MTQHPHVYVITYSTPKETIEAAYASNEENAKYMVEFLRQQPRFEQYDISYFRAPLDAVKCDDEMYDICDIKDIVDSQREAANRGI